jgi:hypothetical protein
LTHRRARAACPKQREDRQAPTWYQRGQSLNELQREQREFKRALLSPVGLPGAALGSREAVVEVGGEPLSGNRPAEMGLSLVLAMGSP